MRLIINILVSIATIFQFLVSCINVLNMKKQETLGGSFNNYFVLNWMFLFFYSRNSICCNIQFQI